MLIQGTPHHQNRCRLTAGDGRKPAKKKRINRFAGELLETG
jgi:hypothetical protein